MLWFCFCKSSKMEIIKLIFNNFALKLTFMKYRLLLIFTSLIIFSCKKEEKKVIGSFAAFSADTTSIKTGDTVHFSDQTPGNPVSWSWRFQGGNPSTSQLRNPVVIYNTSGQFNVFLKVTNADGTDSIEKTNYITVALKAPDAQFTADNTRIYKDDTIHFTDQSSFYPVSWLWKFQGGIPSQSNLQNPVVIYPDTGWFQVKLTVSNAIGSDSMIKDGYIIVRPFVCGHTFLDHRNGKVYPTVLINNQCWMRKNLNIGTMVDSLTAQTDNSIIEKYCYKNMEANCDAYGAYYQWNEMMQYSTAESVQGICPDGWHVPSDAEWYTLENFVDQSINNPNLSGARGTNGGRELKLSGSSGFDALLDGYRNYLGSFSNFGTFAFFWVSTSVNTSNAWIRSVNSTDNKIYRDWYTKERGQNVRCLKD